jgi:hypothetical protein
MNWFTGCGGGVDRAAKERHRQSVHTREHLYFTASFAGNDDLYAYRLKERKLFQLTSGKTGNYYTTVQMIPCVVEVYNNGPAAPAAIRAKPVMERSAAEST